MNTAVAVAAAHSARNTSTLSYFVYCCNTCGVYEYLRVYSSSIMLYSYDVDVFLMCTSVCHTSYSNSGTAAEVLFRQNVNDNHGGATNAQLTNQRRRGGSHGKVLLLLLYCLVARNQAVQHYSSTTSAALAALVRYPAFSGLPHCFCFDF